MVADENGREFEAFYRAHAQAVYGYLRSRTSHHRANELVVETFVVAWRRAEAVSSNAPRTWLIGVARRLLANERRSEDRRESLGLRITAMRAGDFPTEDPAADVVERDSTLAALDRLSAADREVLGLVAWAGLLPHEAAEVLGCSRTTFLMRLHRARKRLALALSTEDGAVHRATRVVVEPSRIQATLPEERVT